MKKYIFAILSAVLIGGVFAIYIFSSDYSSEDVLAFENANHSVYLFQLGVYSSLENANSYASSLESYIIKEVGDLYYIYGAIYSELDLVSTLKSYYDANKIEYAIKEVYIDNDFYIELTSYEDLLLESNNIDVIITANQIILDKYIVA